MTPSAFGMVFALVLFIAGALYFAQKDDRRQRLVGVLGTAVVAGAVGWLAWLAGTQA